MAKGRGTSGRARAVRATPARLLAVDITRQCRLRDAYVRELVNTRRKTSELSHEEFDYAQVLSFGVVMCRGTLDEFIDAMKDIAKEALTDPESVKACPKTTPIGRPDETTAARKPIVRYVRPE